MTADIAEFFLVLATIFACSQMLLSGVTQKISVFKAVATLNFICALISFSLLIICFAFSDFSVALVANHSHMSKPLIYKISATWANHEGSMLMWVLVLASFNMFFAWIPSTNNHKRFTLNVQGFIIAMFGIYTLALSNPFLRMYPVPITGLGLNPLLQDIGLALHPPMLYFGYVGFSIAYASAVATLFSAINLRDWARETLPFIMLSWCFLSLGITLGSWWAYRELGWGGYWFWDPVENASLIPWLSATALLHTLRIIAKTGQLKSWGIILAILTFSLSGVGTFLVRSGSVTSVHSFATDPTRGVAILCIVIALLTLGLIAFLIKNKIYREQTQFTRSSVFIALNNIFIIFFTIVVITGTIYPIILELVFAQKISVGAPYYNSLLAPTVAALLVLCIFAPQIDGIPLYKFLISALISFCITYVLPEFQILAALIIWLAVHLILDSFSLLYEFYKKKFTGSLTMILAHLSFAILALAITINSLSQLETEKIIKLNERITFGSYAVKLLSIDYHKGPNYLSRVAKFEAWHNNKYLGEIKPEARLYPIENQQTTESGILHTLLYDFYITTGETNQNQDIVARIYIRPMVSFIWLGGALLFVTGIISIIRAFVKKI
ncbi:MAG: cytochrome c-type biosis protein CcmF [Candidatus Midichloriaceae bacterium]|jgi:cytochrome c-type biogenesis protein CcmF|nr:cytochrome c-type biosis protein CcmF [Candidatus Midichloriaceae bacterium]